MTARQPLVWIGFINAHHWVSGPRRAGILDERDGHLRPHPEISNIRAARPSASRAPQAAGGARVLLVRASEVQGRPVVLYVDAPAAAGTELLDLARVTVTP